MLKEILGEAFPILEKCAPIFASTFSIKNIPVEVIIEALKILLNVFKQNPKEFSLAQLEKMILESSSTKKLLEKVEDGLIKYLEERLKAG